MNSLKISYTEMTERYHEPLFRYARRIIRSEHSARLIAFKTLRHAWVSRYQVKDHRELHIFLRGTAFIHCRLLLADQQFLKCLKKAAPCNSIINNKQNCK